MDDKLECDDGTECNIEKSDLTWGCCMTRKRKRCPANFPVMCASQSCGYQKKQHCCDVTEDKCNELYGGGSRKCNAKRRFRVSNENDNVIMNLCLANLFTMRLYNIGLNRYTHVECKECFGAQWLDNQCCNTCEAVVALYRIRDWQFDRSDFFQCDPG